MVVLESVEEGELGSAKIIRIGGILSEEISCCIFGRCNVRLSNLCSGKGPTKHSTGRNQRVNEKVTTFRRQLRNSKQYSRKI